MPDEPHVTIAAYQSRGRAAITRATTDAVWTMERAGLPRERILAVTRRIETALLTLLTEEDAISKELFAFGAQPREPEQARRMEAKVAWSQEQMEKAFAAVAILEIQKALEEFKQGFDRPQPVIEGTYRKPWPPDWLATLLRVINALTLGLVWFLTIGVLTLLVWAASGSLVWIGVTLGLSLIFLLFSWGNWWCVGFPLGAITFLVVFVL
jgi:hypothetical protein